MSLGESSCKVRGKVGFITIEGLITALSVQHHCTTKSFRFPHNEVLHDDRRAVEWLLLCVNNFIYDRSHFFKLRFNNVKIEVAFTRH